jgi:hypothetical protein
MRLRLTALAVAATLLSSAPLSAQVPVTFLNGGSVTADGYYVGPYNGLIGTPSQAVLLNCVDFLHHVTNGESWNAYLTAVSDVNTVASHARSTDQIAYEKASWLTTQYPGASNADIGAIQETIWNLFASAAPDPSSTYWYDQATTHYTDPGMNYGQFFVVTPTNAQDASSAQEFIIHVTSTPEPASMTLLATGLIGIFGAVRRKRQAIAEV